MALYAELQRKIQANKQLIFFKVLSMLHPRNDPDISCAQTSLSLNNYVSLKYILLRLDDRVATF